MRYVKVLGLFLLAACASVPERASEPIQCAIPNIYALPREIRKRILDDAVYGCEMQIQNAGDLSVDKQVLLDCLMNRDWFVSLHIQRQKKALLQKAIMRTEMQYVHPMRREVELERLTKYHQTMELPEDYAQPVEQTVELTPETQKIVDDAVKAELEAGRGSE